MQNVDTNANDTIIFSEFIATMVKRGPNTKDDVEYLTEMVIG